LEASTAETKPPPPILTLLHLKSELAAKEDAATTVPSEKAAKDVPIFIITHHLLILGYPN
jgi:hypothetical protein